MKIIKSYFHIFNFFFQIKSTSLCLFILSDIFKSILMSLGIFVAINFFTDPSFSFFNIFFFDSIDQVIFLLIFLFLSAILSIIINSNTLVVLLEINKKLYLKKKNLVAYHRIFLLSISSNIVSFVLIMTIYFINFYDFLFFIFIYLFFLLFPLTPLGSFISKIDKKNFIIKRSTYFFIGKKIEIFSILFLLIILIYCFFSFFFTDTNPINYIYLIICSRFCLSSFNQNIRFIYLSHSNENSNSYF